jgi:hypothetical protein
MYDIPLRANIANSPISRLEYSTLTPYCDAYEYAMVPNWDNDGAASVTPEVVQLAARVIDEHGTTEHLVEVGPGRDGSLSFVWEDDKANYIYLDVGPNDTVHLYRDVTGRPRWEGVSVAGDARILEEISSAFRDAGWVDPPIHVFSFSAGSPNVSRWVAPAFR